MKVQSFEFVNEEDTHCWVTHIVLETVDKETIIFNSHFLNLREGDAPISVMDEFVSQDNLII